MTSNGDPYQYFLMTRFYINLYKTFIVCILKISKTFVSFLRTSGEYLTSFGQESIFKIRFQGSVVKMDPCPYLAKYSYGVLKKKTEVLAIFNTDKKVLYKLM